MYVYGIAAISKFQIFPNILNSHYVRMYVCMNLWKYVCMYVCIT